MKASAIYGSYSIASFTRFSKSIHIRGEKEGKRAPTPMEKNVASCIREHQDFLIDQSQPYNTGAVGQLEHHAMSKIASQLYTYYRHIRGTRHLVRPEITSFSSTARFKFIVAHAHSLLILILKVLSGDGIACIPGSLSPDCKGLVTRNTSQSESRILNSSNRIQIIILYNFHAAVILLCTLVISLTGKHHHIIVCAVNLERHSIVVKSNIYSAQNDVIVKCLQLLCHQTLAVWAEIPVRRKAQNL